MPTCWLDSGSEEMSILKLHRDLSVLELGANGLFLGLFCRKHTRAAVFGPLVFDVMNPRFGKFVSLQLALQRSPK